MNKWLIGGVIFCLVVLVVVKYWPLFYLSLAPTYKGDEFQTWQTESQHFRVRVDAFYEANGGLVPGAFYTFSSAPAGSEEWKEIMTFRHDDPIDIQSEKVRMVSDDAGYAFMGWRFASTSDAGRTWLIWDACDQAKELKVCNYEGIKTVEMSADGKGKMTLNPIPGASPAPILSTEDFGRSWY